MVFYYPLEYTLMEITDSLETDIKDAPNWFHSAISQSPRKENLRHLLGNVAYQVWDRKDAQDILFLFMVQVHISNGGIPLRHFYVTNFLSLLQIFPGWESLIIEMHIISKTLAMH